MCTYYLDNIIDDDTVDRISGDLISLFNGKRRIVIRRNMGGSLRCAKKLIELISYCKDADTKIVVEAEGFIVSAAAFLYFSLLFKSRSGEFPHVSVIDPSLPVLVVYHKPRANELTGFMQFAENLRAACDRDSLLAEMEEWERETDQLLPKIMDLIGYSDYLGASFDAKDGGVYLSQADHALCAYHRNYEFVFRYPT